MAACRAALISAPSSGQGKTTVTAALARCFADRGERVTIFKVGADFLDPMALERASRAPVYQLDLFMGGEAHCRALLARAAAQSDLVLVEGVMGLYDGEPSSADLAATFGLPVVAVIDAAAMAGTFGAIVHGLASYRPGVRLIGAIANSVGSEGHAAMLNACLPSETPLIAYLPRADDIALPERHLGLVQAAEVAEIDASIGRAAARIGATLSVELPEVEFADAPTPAPLAPRLAGRRVAVARDEAFSFLYRANVETLEMLGAEVVFFSPLREEALPRCDALYLPGGYPELHLDRLAANETLKGAIRGHHAAGKPILAECGGLLYLLDRLVAEDGASAAMTGLIKGSARMLPRLAALALQSVALPEGELRGHTFHHSVAAIDEPPLAVGICPNGGRTSERVYRKGRLTASYVHFYFPSNPEAAATLFTP